ncbi:transcriptional regulator [Actinomycetospora corticicola]|uniref:Putative ArsR family transcriptional regulator n=1 Tax=Actinomycetospora corticicola TaxID=663602 RepID=A0A7Y9DUK4_9PSEU|nr:metalloregulator ArsR/SmtB family transcription factor [Actinomycetospora corticicola]NYD35432.1 putative ArsR family transcriptional regulator [Actinomycetospora corticicola]
MTGTRLQGAHAEHARSAADGRTRDAVVRLLLERGPTTAATLADQLQLSGPGVRRHLDALCTEGTVATRDAPASGKRGRPARQFLLTTDGRARAGRGEHGPADLAVAALRRLGDAAGDEAVRAFARDRALAMVGAHREHVEAGADRAERVQRLATALTAEGYAASSRGATSTGGGEQLCQHHCPVADVAAEFPQLCEAEAEVFAEVLGTHVQRLATIARGDAACTTHVPAQRAQRTDTTARPSAVTTGGAPEDQGRQVV